MYVQVDMNLKQTSVGKPVIHDGISEPNKNCETVLVKLLQL